MEGSSGEEPEQRLIAQIATLRKYLLLMCGCYGCMNGYPISNQEMHYGTTYLWHKLPDDSGEMVCHAGELIWKALNEPHAEADEVLRYAAAGRLALDPVWVEQALSYTVGRDSRYDAVDALVSKLEEATGVHR